MWLAIFMYSSTPTVETLSWGRYIFSATTNIQLFHGNSIVTKDLMDHRLSVVFFSFYLPAPIFHIPPPPLQKKKKKLFLPRTKTITYQLICLCAMPAWYFFQNVVSLLMLGKLIANFHFEKYDIIDLLCWSVV